MSHLAHIVKLKQDLIANDVTDPSVQIHIVRTAYVKALINIGTVNKLDEDTCIDFNRYVLGYWNETTPVDGALVMNTIGRFFRAMDAFLRSTITANTMEIPIVEGPEGVKYKWEQLESYSSLVSTLIKEATHKLEHFLPAKVSE